MFHCPEGDYAIGDPEHASPEGLPPGRPEPGIVGYFGAFHVGLEMPGEVTLHVRRLTKAQYRDGAPLAIPTDAAVASNRVGVMAQGPMEVFSGSERVGLVGGTAGRSYWAQWYCLSRGEGAEEHLLGLYVEPAPGEQPDPDGQLNDRAPLARLAATLEAAGTPLLRTDFSDDEAWTAVVSEVTKPADFGGGYDDYEPSVTPFDDRFFEGATRTALAGTWTSEGLQGGYVLLADARSMAEAADGGEVTVEYVDLSVADDADAELFGSYPGRAFRCAAREVASTEANLAIANMDFSDFADNVEDDGVFRGFRRSE